MPTGVFIGTFDPLHGAHIGQLLRANKRFPFSHVYILVDKNPPHKPNATAWHHRIAMANLTLASFELPFEYSVQAVADSRAKELATTADYKITGIDSLIENLQDPARWELTTQWPMIVVSIPGVEKSSLEQSLAQLPPDMRSKVSYQYVSEDDVPMMNYDFETQTFVSYRVHATHLRQGRNKNLLPSATQAYMQAQRLYK